MGRRNIFSKNDSISGYFRPRDCNICAFVHVRATFAVKIRKDQLNAEEITPTMQCRAYTTLKSETASRLNGRVPGLLMEADMHPTVDHIAFDVD